MRNPRKWQPEIPGKSFIPHKLYAQFRCQKIAADTIGRTATIEG